MTMNWQKLTVGITLCLSAMVAFTQDQERPKLPRDEWSSTNFAVAHSACVKPGCKPFDPSAHAAMTPEGAVCSNELNAAIYRQDVLHAFESKAHFDNCAFDESTAYIESLVKEAFKKVALASKETDRGAISPQARDAMLALGQALHAIQDFYAHSNYVELMQQRLPNMTDEGAIPLIEVWTPAGRAALKKLASNGLVSGVVWWSVPHQCNSNALTHAELAKDSSSTAAGKQPSLFKNRLTQQPISNHTVSFNLASRATRQFLLWAGQSSPKIESICGPTLKYIVQPDRRSQ